MNICMLGAGYVGLVSAACFSEFGSTVACIDKDGERIARLRRREMPIYEPGLEDLIKRNVDAGRLLFSVDLAAAVSQARVVMLAVGTPRQRGDGHVDLGYIFAAVEEVAPHLRGFTVVVTKSTVPVGTSRQIEARLKALRPDAEFAVCSNPEFLREGAGLQDFMHPDRVLIGCDDARAREVMQRLYKPLALRNAPVIFASRESAELAKYAANAFLAMRISFINEIADLCERVGADVQEVAEAIGRDRRIGDRFLHPGPGYGGSCLPKDVSALIRTARENLSPLSVVEAVHRINEKRKIGMAQRIKRAAGGSVRGKTIGVLGITFKPNTDDMREAPSLTIIPILHRDGALIQGYDPKGRHHGQALLPGVKWCSSALEAARDADIVVLLTEWNEFRAIDFKSLKRAMRGNVLIDTRNVFIPSEARLAGFDYFGVGRPDGTRLGNTHRLDRLQSPSRDARRPPLRVPQGRPAVT